MTKVSPLLIPLTGSEKYQPLLKNASQTVNLKAGHVCLKPGESVGEHVTDKREEAVVILEGEASVSCEGHADLKAKGPCVVYVPPEKKHNIANSGSGLLRYVYVVTMLNVSL